MRQTSMTWLFVGALATLAGGPSAAGAAKSARAKAARAGKKASKKAAPDSAAAAAPAPAAQIDPAPAGAAAPAAGTAAAPVTGTSAAPAATPATGPAAAPAPAAAKTATTGAAAPTAAPAAGTAAAPTATPAAGTAPATPGTAAAAAAPSKNPLFAADFSATVVSQPKPGQPKTELRLFGSSEALRVEALLGLVTLTSIYDRAKPAYMTLYSTNRSYLESSPITIPSMARGHLERYATSTSGNPCEYKQSVTCTAGAEEDVNSRRSRRWEAKFADGQAATYWVDTELRLIIKANDPRFSFDVKNVKVAPQPAELFVAPPDYTRKG